MERLLILVFFCYPPLLFFLNRKCSKKLSTVGITLVSFLLGWGLCFPVGMLFFASIAGGVTSEEVSEVAKVALFMTIMSGWFVSAVVLVLWSPIIAIIAVKNRKIKALMGIIILGYILLLSFASVHDRYDWGVPGNRLIHKGSTHAGFDSSHMQVFKAENDLLKQKLIRKWDLKNMSVSSGEGHPTSFAAIDNDKPDWWPSRDVLYSLEGYGWEDKSEEHYRSLWYDPDSQKLYFEWGYW
ncbi:MAG: hypothetical protein GY774_18800 [Planctomycetes bacterium]|nr:hypothetical protein [Planctomycetota bacterium]